MKDFKQYNGKYSKEMFDYISIKNNMEFVIKSCEICRKNIGEKYSDDLSNLTEEDRILITGLINSAIVAYARCFNGGNKKIKLNRELFNCFHKQGEKLIETHDYIIDLRNKFIAHSVNGFEVSRIGLVIEENKVVGIGEVYVTTVLADYKHVEIVLNLAKLVKLYLAEKIGELKEKILEICKSFNSSEIDLLKKVIIDSPDMKKVKKSRKI